MLCVCGQMNENSCRREKDGRGGRWWWNVEVLIICRLGNTEKQLSVTNGHRIGLSYSSDGSRDVLSSTQQEIVCLGWA